jgi:hypothetical protein
VWGGGAELKGEKLSDDNRASSSSSSFFFFFFFKRYGMFMTVQSKA